MKRTLRRGVLSWKSVKNLFFSLMSLLLLLVLFLEKCADSFPSIVGSLGRADPTGSLDKEKLDRERSALLPQTNARRAKKNYASLW